MTYRDAVAVAIAQEMARDETVVLLGEDVAAAVVFKEGASAPADELRRFCLATLADYKVPRRWLFVEALPRNATDKVVKHEVRALFGAASGGSGASASGEESPR